MHLAMTADERYWNTERPILFLGDWCQLHQRRDVWSALEHEVLPCVWEDRRQFHAACEYLEELHERYLEALAHEMNRLQGFSYSTRYWRIVVGLWLRAFAESLYDRYVSLEAAAATGKVSGTWIGSPQPCVPPTVPSFAFDEYNQHLFSQLVAAMRTIPYEVRTFPVTAKPAIAPLLIGGLRATAAREVQRHLRKGWRVLLRQSVATFSTGVYTHIVQNLAPNRVVFAGTLYESPWRLARLQLALGQVPYIFNGWKPIDPSKRVIGRADLDLRANVKLPAPRNEFERVLNAILPYHIPVIYLEDYGRLRAESLVRTPKRPRVIVTAYSMNYRQNTEIWIAEQVERHGSKLVVTQHGGAFGSFRNISLENHWRKSVDRYYTWGDTSGPEVAKPLPALRLMQTAREIAGKTDPDGPILWLATTLPRYRIYFDSGPAGSLMLRYFDDQVELLKHVRPEVKDLLLWRYFNALWDEDRRLRDIAPGLKMQRGLKHELGRKSDFVIAVQKSRLSLHTCNSTTYLQTLAANVPTVVFWNPNYEEVRAEAIRPLERLSKVGILHLTPQSAAAHLNRVYADPDKWWRTAAVQAARQEFCDSLAFTHSDWFRMWRNELSSLTERQTGVPNAR